MKVLVTGVKGQLGHDVVTELERRGHEAVGVDIEEMDITDKASVDKVVTSVIPDAVVHCAAWTAVDAAEDAAGDVFQLVEKSHSSCSFLRSGGGVTQWSRRSWGRWSRAERRSPPPCRSGGSGRRPPGAK